MPNRKKGITYKIAAILWIELMSANIMHERTISVQVTALLYVHTKREREREREREGGGEERRTLTVPFYKDNVAQTMEFLFFLLCGQILNARCTVNCIFIRRLI
jgi:hypothetical protein